MADQTAEPLSPAEQILRWELIAVAIVIALASAWYWSQAHHIWFHNDYWGLLVNHDLTPAGLFSDHAGHLAVLHVVATQTTAALFGEDAWRALIAVRVAAWSVLVLTSWIVARKRGSSAAVALVYAATLTVFALSGWVRGWLVGNPSAVAATIAAALLIDSGKPTLARRFAVAVLCLFLAMSTSLGVVGLGALLVAAVVYRAARPYVPIIAGAVGAYAVWYLTLKGTGGPGFHFDAIADVPWNIAQIATDGFATYTGLSFRVGAVALICLLGGLAWSYTRRPPTAFDLTIALWALGFTTIVSLSRIAAGQAQVQANRYEYVVVLALLAVTVPRIKLRVTRRSVSVAMIVLTVLAGAYLVDVNRSELQVALRFWDHWSSTSRPIVEAAGTMIRDGEPYLPNAPVDDRHTGMLTASGLADTVGRGWFRDRLPYDDEVEKTARGDLRILARGGTGTGFTACLPVDTGNEVPVPVEELSVSVETPSELRFSYEDDFGTGVKRVVADTRILPLPSDSAEMAVTAESGSASVCTSP